MYKGEGPSAPIQPKPENIIQTAPALCIHPDPDVSGDETVDLAEIGRAVFQASSAQWLDEFGFKLPRRLDLLSVEMGRGEDPVEIAR